MNIMSFFSNLDEEVEQEELRHILDLLEVVHIMVVGHMLVDHIILVVEEHRLGTLDFIHMVEVEHLRILVILHKVAIHTLLVIHTLVVHKLQLGMAIDFPFDITKVLLQFSLLPQLIQPQLLLHNLSYCHSHLPQPPQLLW